MGGGAGSRRSKTCLIGRFNYPEAQDVTHYDFTRCLYKEIGDQRIVSESRWIIIIIRRAWSVQESGPLIKHDKGNTPPNQMGRRCTSSRASEATSTLCSKIVGTLGAQARTGKRDLIRQLYLMGSQQALERGEGRACALKPSRRVLIERRRGRPGPLHVGR